jgi:hypothetical protein
MTPFSLLYDNIEAQNLLLSGCYRPPVQGAVRIGAQDSELWANGEGTSVLDPDPEESNLRGRSPTRPHGRREENTVEIQLETL